MDWAEDTSICASAIQHQLFCSWNFFCRFSHLQACEHAVQSYFNACGVFQYAIICQICQNMYLWLMSCLRKDLSIHSVVRSPSKTFLYYGPKIANMQGGRNCRQQKKNHWYEKFYTNSSYFDDVLSAELFITVVQTQRQWWLHQQSIKPEPKLSSEWFSALMVHLWVTTSDKSNSHKSFVFVLFFSFSKYHQITCVVNRPDDEFAE